MKTARLLPSRRFDILDEPVPAPAPGEALVQVRSVGLCGSDRHYVAADSHVHTAEAAGLVLGHEAAGQVAAVGDGVTHLAVGTRVAIDPAQPCGQCRWCRAGQTNVCPNMRFLGYPPTDGALRQYIAWPAELLVAAGEQTSFDRLAMAEPLAIALYALQCARPDGARSAAVIGCGAIGLLLVQLLSRRGVSPLLAADRFEHKLALARDFGATDVVDTSKQDIVSSAERTTPRGFDLVFEMAGDVDAPGWAVELAAPAGRVVLGGINPHETIRYKASTARRRGLVIANLRRSKDTTRQAIEMIERGHVEVDRLVTHHFGLAQIDYAFDLFMAYRDNVVKVCIDPASE